MKILRRENRLLTMPRLTAMTIVVAVFISSQVAGASTLQASWYSYASLRKEGTWKTHKERMANNEWYGENRLTCACRLYPLGSWLRITNLANNKEVTVRVTDRIGKRFAQTRIDLSKLAFSRIAELKEGIVNVSVEEL